MENITRIKDKCVGCKSCEQSCPKHCISMVESNEGFWYPLVDEKSCIECRLCLKKCPIEETKLHRNEPKKVWAWRNKNDADIMRSASGGVADSAAKTILQMGGVVYGAAYDEQLAVSHIEITDDVGREKIQSSKYVQSDPKDSYSKVKQHLAEGRKVLFTGTPCQIAGLYAFLGGDQKNLYTVDLICHGVPSPKFFKKYLEYLNKQMAGRVIYFNFRSKDKRGWGTQYLLKTKTKTKTISLDRYGKHFMDGDCYRECCYQCAYANTNRVGDLTVGDFWGIAKSHPNFNSPKGVSSVFINTEKGQELFEMMKPLAEVEEATLEEGMVKQGNLIKPSLRPNDRNTFYEKIEEDNFMDNLKVGIQPKERIKAVLPAGAVRFLKKWGGVIEENYKVSVIVPVYNVAPFLEMCVDSILSQTWDFIEVILVDDGSTDNSGLICDQMKEKDNRVKVLHKCNGGVSAARNSGMEMASGGFICFVDGDDYVMPDYIEYMLEQIIKNEADIALTTQMFGNYDEKQVENDEIKIWNGEDAIEAILCYQVPIGCYCKLFRANFLKDIHFIPEIYIGEGFNFNVAAFQKADKVIVGKRKTYYYRRDNPTSAMTKFSLKKCECGLWALEVIRENLTLHSKRIRKAWSFANWRTHSDFYDMCVLAGAKKEYPELYKKCLSITRKDALSAFHVPTSKQTKSNYYVDMSGSDSDCYEGKKIKIPC